MNDATPVAPSARRTAPPARVELLPAEPFALPPLVLGEKHSAELSQPVGRVFELAEDDGAFVDVLNGGRPFLKTAFGCRVERLRRWTRLHPQSD